MTHAHFIGRAGARTLLSLALAGCTSVPGHHGAGSGPQCPMDGGMAGGQRGMMGMATRMRAMDANGDGMISREEFLKAHEAMYNAMRKNERGQVSITDMPACPMPMMPSSNAPPR